jgi:hypothetical protein
MLMGSFLIFRNKGRLCRAHYVTDLPCTPNNFADI